MSSYQGRWPPPYEPWELDYKRPEDKCTTFETFATFKEAVDALCDYLKDERYEGCKFTITRRNEWRW